MTAGSHGIEGIWYLFSNLSCYKLVDNGIAGE
jgi:hypothetical protein